MKRATVAIFALSAALFFYFTKQVAAEGQGPTGTDSHGLDPAVLIGVAIMLLVAKLSGELFERLRQPAVLGELFAGILLGNLVIFGFYGAESLKTNETIAALAELGVAGRCRPTSSLRNLDSLTSLSAPLSVRHVERGVNRLAVGLGMIPRGEVGLIFAGIGATLMLPTQMA